MTVQNKYTTHKLEPENWNTNYRRLLIQLTVAKVSDYHTAEDLVQETFVAAWKSVDRFRGECAEKTFLTGILKNKIIDHYRNKARRPVSPVSQIESNDTEEIENWIENRADPETANDPSELLSRQEFLIDLNRAVDKLPGKMAQAYRLAVLEERPTNEVTRLLSITSTNLWVMIHRARKQLRVELMSAWEGDSFSG